MLLQSRPLGDGRVTLQLTPLVEHGEVRSRIAHGPGNFILDSRPDERVFEQLGFESTITPGATLLLSGSAEPKGLGAWYFGGETDRVLLLIRLVQTQLDGLFLDESTDDMLTTPLD